MWGQGSQRGSEENEDQGTIAGCQQLASLLMILIYQKRRICKFMSLGLNGHRANGCSWTKSGPWTDILGDRRHPLSWHPGSREVSSQLSQRDIPILFISDFTHLKNNNNSNKNPTAMLCLNDILGVRVDKTYAASVEWWGVGVQQIKERGCQGR